MGRPGKDLTAFIVNVIETKGVLSTDKTIDEVKAAHDEGRIIVATDGKRIMNLTTVDYEYDEFIFTRVISFGVLESWVLYRGVNDEFSGYTQTFQFELSNNKTTSFGAYYDDYYDSELYPTVNAVRDYVEYPRVFTSILTNELMPNAIYDLGVQTDLTLNLPYGQTGLFIQIDFVSGNVPTKLTINSPTGLSDIDLVPERNKTYTLFFDYGTLYSASDDVVQSGWRFGYAEYSDSEV